MEVTDECWHFAQNCERWATGEKDPQVRNAFYRMAKSFAQLAFQERDAGNAPNLISSDAEAAMTLLALELTSKQLSVPVYGLRERGRHSVVDVTVDELKKHGNPGRLTEQSPEATAEGLSTPPMAPNEADDASK